MFIGRERELESLGEFYEKDGIGMTVIYGRRHIGKTTLIAEFTKDKKSKFLSAPPWKTAQEISNNLRWFPDEYVSSKNERQLQMKQLPFCRKINVYGSLCQ